MSSYSKTIVLFTERSFVKIKQIFRAKVFALENEWIFNIRNIVRIAHTREWDEDMGMDWERERENIDCLFELVNRT